MIFVLAAGEQKRWGDHSKKQLLPIKGEAIISRTLRLARCHYPIVVTHHQDIINKSTVFFKPDNRRWTTETLLSTSCYWKNGQITILLGDVIYSPRVINLIIDCQDKFRVFGNTWEIFGLSFNDVEGMKKACLETIRQAEDGQHLGKLRNLFHTYTGVEQKNDTGHPYFEWIDAQFNDYTNDIDTPEEYENFLRQRINEVE